MTKQYRTGAIGALLDIYEQAITDLQETISAISNTSLVIVIDPLTPNVDCRSLQAILTHVVHAGFGYITSICNAQGNAVIRPPKQLLSSIDAYVAALHEMFTYTQTVFQSLTDHDLEQLEEARKIRTGWGQHYDVEQLMEHAIVHILRHRRQIEKLKNLLPKHQAE